MKLYANLFGILLLTTAMTACGDDGEPPLLKNEVRPVSPGREVSDFFEQNLGRLAYSIFYGKDEYGLTGPLFIDSCVMFNSADELPKADLESGTPLEYPAIDFDAHTLVIGQWQGGSSGVYLVSRSLIVEHGMATMNLTFKERDGIHELVGRPAHFWGLYPKIATKTIHTNVILKK